MAEFIGQGCRNLSHPELQLILNWQLTHLPDIETGYSVCFCRVTVRMND